VSLFVHYFSAEISTPDLYVTTCHYEFHRECIGNHLKKNDRPPAEPTERVVLETRSIAKNLSPAIVDGGNSTSARCANTNEAIVVQAP